MGKYVDYTLAKSVLDYRRQQISNSATFYSADQSLEGAIASANIGAAAKGAENVVKERISDKDRSSKEQIANSQIVSNQQIAAEQNASRERMNASSIASEELRNKQRIEADVEMNGVRVKSAEGIAQDQRNHEEWMFTLQRGLAEDKIAWESAANFRIAKYQADKQDKIAYRKQMGELAMQTARMRTEAVQSFINLLGDIGGAFIKGKLAASVNSDDYTGGVNESTWRNFGYGESL